MGVFDFFKKIFKKKGFEMKSVKEFSDGGAADREILDTLKQRGDNANICRPVRHFCYFKTKTDLTKFLILPKIRSAPKEATAKGTGVVVTLNSTMYEEDIFAQIDEMTRLTSEAGGNYDGWETSVEK